MKMNSFKLYFDGGCWPNPGPAYGSYAIVNSHEQVVSSRLRIPFGKATNNQAEYMALFCALEAASNLDEKDILRTCSLEIWSDSMLLVKQMSKQWKVKNDRIKQQWQICQSLLEGWKSWSIHWHSRTHNEARFGH